MEKQDAYKLFGRPANGITPRIFRKQLKKWGIVLSSRDNQAVFSYFDVTNSGTITFQELVSRLMTKDYSGKTWNVVIDERNDALNSKHREIQPRMIRSSEVLTDEKLRELSKLLQTKILERTKHGNREIGDAYKLFGRPQNGITKALFNTLLEKVGMYLRPTELDSLYQSFDKNGSGTLTFEEFIAGVMPHDFTGKLWNVKIDERNDAIAQKKLKKHSKSKRRKHKRHQKSIDMKESSDSFKLESISM